jgi:hypothetical protein
MDAHERPWLEPLLQVAQPLPERVDLLPGVDPDVVVGGLDPVDLVDGEKVDAVTVADDEPLLEPRPPALSRGLRGLGVESVRLENRRSSLRP